MDYLGLVLLLNWLGSGVAVVTLVVVHFSTGLRLAILRPLRGVSGLMVVLYVASILHILDLDRFHLESTT